MKLLLITRNNHCDSLPAQVYIKQHLTQKFRAILNQQRILDTIVDKRGIQERHALRKKVDMYVCKIASGAWNYESLTSIVRSRQTKLITCQTFTYVQKKYKRMICRSIDSSLENTYSYTCVFILLQLDFFSVAIRCSRLHPLWH